MGSNGVVGVVFLDCDLLGQVAHPAPRSNEAGPLQKPWRQDSVINLRERIALVVISVSVVLAHKPVVVFPAARFGIYQVDELSLLLPGHHLQEMAEARHGIYRNPWYGAMRRSQTSLVHLVNLVYETPGWIDESDERHRHDRTRRHSETL